MSANADLYLFDGEVIDQVVVVFVEAAVQRHTVRVEEQILRKRKKEPLNPNPNRNVEPGPDDSYCYFSTHSGHSTIVTTVCGKCLFVTADCGESILVSKENWRQRICFPVKRGFSLNPFKCCASDELLLVKYELSANCFWHTRQVSIVV